MHHSEISKIIAIINRYFLVTDEGCSIKVESFKKKDELGETLGLRLSLCLWANPLKIEMDSDDRDSNEVNFYFSCPTQRCAPTYSIQYAETNFRSEPIDELMGVLISIAKGKQPFSELDSPHFYNRTGLKRINHQNLP